MELPKMLYVSISLAIKDFMQTIAIHIQLLVLVNARFIGFLILARRMGLRH